jgi:hypothetical protein
LETGALAIERVFAIALHALRNNSGSFATFDRNLRASSLLSSLAADRRPGSSSHVHSFDMPIPLPSEFRIAQAATTMADVMSQCPAGKLQFTIGDLSSNDGDDIRAAASAKALVNGSTSLCAEIPSAALGDEREVCLISL